MGKQVWEGNITVYVKIEFDYEPHDDWRQEFNKAKEVALNLLRGIPTDGRMLGEQWDINWLDRVECKDV